MIFGLESVGVFCSEKIAVVGEIGRNNPAVGERSGFVVLAEESLEERSSSTIEGDGVTLSQLELSGWLESSSAVAGSLNGLVK